MVTQYLLYERRIGKALHTDMCRAFESSFGCLLQSCRVVNSDLFIVRSVLIAAAWLPTIATQGVPKRYVQVGDVANNGKYYFLEYVIVISQSIGDRPVGLAVSKRVKRLCLLSLGWLQSCLCTRGLYPGRIASKFLAETLWLRYLIMKKPQNAQIANRFVVFLQQLFVSGHCCRHRMTAFFCILFPKEFRGYGKQNDGQHQQKQTENYRGF